MAGRGDARRRETVTLVSTPARIAVERLPANRLWFLPHSDGGHLAPR